MTETPGGRGPGRPASRRDSRLLVAQPGLDRHADPLGRERVRILRAEGDIDAVAAGLPALVALAAVAVAVAFLAAGDPLARDVGAQTLRQAQFLVGAAVVDRGVTEQAA